MNYAVPVNYGGKHKINDFELFEDKCIYFVSSDDETMAEKNAWEIAQKLCDKTLNSDEQPIAYYIKNIEKPYKISEKIENGAILYSEILCKD